MLAFKLPSAARFINKEGRDDFRTHFLKSKEGRVGRKYPLNAVCKYPLNAVLHISKKCCTFARRHHFSNFETRIRNLALHQHKLMEVIP